LVDRGIESGDMGAALKDVLATRKSISESLRGECTKDKRNQLVNLCTLYTEFEDLLNEMKQENANKAAIWKDEVKYYKNADGTFHVKCGEFQLDCGDDFGPLQMLVTTKLTRTSRKLIIDCIINKKVWFPWGPAGTGKTETCKDVLRMMGWNADVYNCSDDNYDKMVAEIKKSIAQGRTNPVIFDEFNRLPANQQEPLLAITRNAGIFTDVTMNPDINGNYTKEWCANVPHIECEYTIPDFETILRAMFSSEGCLDYSNLARNFDQWRAQCLVKLSKQMHYDWGMRFMKRTVNSVGIRLRAPGNTTPEMQILANYLHESLQNYLIDNDFTEAMGLMQQYIGKADAYTLEKSKGMGLKERVSAQLGVEQRWGVSVLGNVDAETWKGVQTYAAEKSGHKAFTIEAGPVESSFGADGSVIKVVREAIACGQKCAIYISGDHSAKPEYIENFNTVTDGNRCMVLGETGEKLDTRNVAVVFLMKTCDHVSPAFVSRTSWVVA